VHARRDAPGSAIGVAVGERFFRLAPWVRRQGNVVSEIERLLQWSGWRPLDGASRDRELPRTPGLYRIRRSGRDDLDYIGQTGVGLRQRLGMLRGVYGGEMPYRGPPTAAPALWALRHASECEFEVSVAIVEGAAQWRKGMEAVAIALYRRDHNQSPTIEFGRMPPGYRGSSANTGKLAAAGKRYRGGPDPGVRPVPDSSVPPAGSLTGDPVDSGWSGHQRQPWAELAPGGLAQTVATRGLYRIRGDADGPLLYVGQGAIPDRPLAHLAKMRRTGDEAARVLSGQRRLQASWVENQAWSDPQRPELENDRIAAHILETGAVPLVQFLG